VRILAALLLAGAAVLFAPAPDAEADGTCTFAAPVIIISLAAPVTIVCGDGDITSVTHSTDVQIDPSLLGRAPAQ
jgi:hypothetical protein